MTVLFKNIYQINVPSYHQARTLNAISNMADGAEESGNKIKITIKTPKEKKDVEIDSAALVNEVNI